MWEIIFGVLAGIFVLVVLIGTFLPSKLKFSRTLSIDAERKTIFGYLEDLHKWKLWSQWSPENDAPITFTHEGKEKGSGAMMRWKGRKMGAGKIEIKECVPHKFLMAEISFSSGFKLQSFFELIQDGNTTHVTWRMEGKIKRFGVARFIGLMIPRWMGKDMQTALKILKMHSEK
ncbi:MAG: SRPBCC family protein [Chitinophagales bacterium]